MGGEEEVNSQAPRIYNVNTFKTIRYIDKAHLNSANCLSFASFLIFSQLQDDVKILLSLFPDCRANHGCQHYFLLNKVAI